MRVSELEDAFDTHQAHPTLAPTYNPGLLRRAPAISSDISFFLDTEAWKTHPVHQSLVASPPPALSAYIQRIKDLSKSSDPSALLGHLGFNTSNAIKSALRWVMFSTCFSSWYECMLKIPVLQYSVYTIARQNAFTGVTVPSPFSASRLLNPRNWRQFVPRGWNN